MTLRSIETAIASKGLFTSDNEYRNVVRKREVEDGWVKWVRSFHWDYFLTPTFKWPVSDEYARSEAEEFVREIEQSASAFVGWGGGQEHSCHLLLNFNNEWMRARHRRKMTKRRLQLLWKHGEIKVDPFDARRARKAVKYFVDHHEVDLIGEPVRHRVRTGF